MKRFADAIKDFDDYISTGAVEDERIRNAEEELGLEFSKEYKEFLSEHGAASAHGHEFMGICDTKRLDIVEGTIKEKEKNKEVPEDFYLIENMGIDKILVWQNKEGKLYQTVGKSKPEIIDNTLSEYVCE